MRTEYTDHAGKPDALLWHFKYYGQFVTPEIIEKVIRQFGMARLSYAYAQGWAMNDIPLREWDSFMGWNGYTCHSFGTSVKLREAGDCVSASSIVCILKEAARQAVIANSSNPSATGV